MHMLPLVVLAPFPFVFVVTKNLKSSPERTTVLQTVDAFNLVRHRNITVVMTDGFKHGAQDAILILGLTNAVGMATNGQFLREVVSNWNSDGDLGLGFLGKVSSMSDDLGQVTLSVFQFLLSRFSTHCERCQGLRHSFEEAHSTVEFEGYTNVVARESHDRRNESVDCTCRLCPQCSVVGLAARHAREVLLIHG